MNKYAIAAVIIVILLIAYFVFGSSNTRKLYAVARATPSRVTVSWTPTGEPNEKSMTVFTSPGEGLVQYTACHNTNPDRDLIVEGSVIPAGWTVGPQWYAYSAAGPDRTAICYGDAPNPLRGIIGLVRATCDTNGWTNRGVMHVPK